MSQQDLTRKLREQYREEILGEKSKKPFEEKLQEALDNTTPEFPGTPNRTPDRGEESEDAQWI